MIQYFRKIFLLLIPAAILLTACDSNDSPTPAPNEPAPRTVLVYMIANNSLGYSSSHYDLNDISEMLEAAAAGALGNSRLIVFRHAYTNANPQLIEITDKGQKVLKEYTPTPSSASEEVMNQVIADTKKYAPATRYGIILWSHASGWLNTGIDTPEAAPLSFGYDGKESSTMSITSLANVLDGKGFDFIYFDCCFMASVEVAYELRNAAIWMVGSAAELPANGTPYHLVLPYLMPEKADCAGAAGVTMDYYAGQYDPWADVHSNPDAFGATFSAIYLPSMEQLAHAVKAVYNRQYPVTDRLLVQQFGPQTNRNDFVDLKDFIEHMEGITEAEKEAVEQALESAVPYNGATEGIHMSNSFTVNHHCGLTTFMPTSAAAFSRKNYNRLEWYRDAASFLYDINQ